MHENLYRIGVGGYTLNLSCWYASTAIVILKHCYLSHMILTYSQTPRWNKENWLGMTAADNHQFFREGVPPILGPQEAL